MITPAGTNIGRYEIRSMLGAGGMGEVYLAQDTQLDRSVALKILPAQLASDEQRMRRFAQEARAASALNHPNILTIYEVGQVDSLHFISTEYVDGVTLRQIMAGARMTLREIFDIILQVASALASAHAAGIVHRDIKPENIMLRRDGYVKVLDFGLAKLTEKLYKGAASDPEAPTKPVVNTDPGVVMGTVTYMSPEQARGLPVDERTDIWSIGCIFYEMLTGRVPFSGRTPSDVIASILEREPQPLTRYAKEVPPELERIVGKTLEKDAEERYQTVKDLLVDVRRLKRRLDLEAELERVVGPDSQPEVKRDGGTQNGETTRDSSLTTGKTEEVHHVSSAEYLIGEIKRHKWRMVAALLILAALGASVFYFYQSRQTAIDSVAVLPFVNVDSDPTLEYLSDGVAQTIRNNLSELPGLRVVQRSTVFRYKGQASDPQKVGKDLNVRAVLSGRMMKKGNTLIVDTELIDVLKEAQVWGGQYRRNQSDIIGGAENLDLQEEIAKQILDSVRAKFPTSTGQTPR